MPTASLNELENVLRNRFALQQFRPGQIEVISRLLNGNSSLAIFPTGGGKSLCYQLPAVLLPNLTIVVSPLLALIREQVDVLNSSGICAVRIDSTITTDEYQATVRCLREQKAKLLYVAPERLFNERFRELLRTLKVDLLAVDEAHCISQWGHNFRPDYLRLGDVIRQYQIPTVLGLTATATPPVAADIRQTLGIQADDEVRTSSYRPNLHLQFEYHSGTKKFHRLCQAIDATPGPTIVYTTLQATSEQVADFLKSKGYEAYPYHAGMDDAARREIQDRFMQSNSAIVVATIAFGMGIDKANIRMILHYNMSNGLENYAQEIGRAGRDGGDSLCLTLLDEQDRTILQNFAHGDMPKEESVQDLMRFLSGQREDFYVSYYHLAHEHDIRDNVLRTIFTYLELDGYISAVGPRYDKYEFKPIKPLHWIVQQFHDERKSFADSVLSMSVKKKIWTEVNMPIAAQRLNQPRHRIMAMLEYFAEKGWIELRPSGLMFGYRVLKRFEGVDEVADRVFKRLAILEARSLERIEQLIELSTSNSCQANRLAQHFGDAKIADCKKCSACQGKPPSSSVFLVTPGKIGASTLSMLRHLKAQFPEELRSYRQCAKFLCGITSPVFVRKRLTREEAFGCCRHLPFLYVLEQLEQSS